MRMCDAAEAVLRETGCPGVMWGDSGLLDQIAVRAGSVRKRPVVMRNGSVIDDHPMCRWKRVLDALSRQPGNLVAATSNVGGRTPIRVRSFWLPEHSPLKRP